MKDFNIINYNNSMENKTKKIEIEIPVGKEAKWVDGVLTLVDETPKDNRPVTERVKTFEDAVHELGDEHPFVKEWHLGDDLSADLEAYLRLRIITAALNEGWEPQFTKGERRWYFDYDLITKEQYDKLSAEDKSRMVGRGAYYVTWYSVRPYGSRLAFKSEKLAAYAGRRFAEIYADFCFKPKSEEAKG